MNNLKYVSNARFGGYGITKNDYLELVKFVSDNGLKTVLEFGPGASTWAFLETECAVWSIEYEPKFAKIAEGTFKGFDNVRVFCVPMTHPIQTPREIEGKRFDMCLVDSPFGGYYRYFARLNSIIYAMAVTDTILVHDSKRKKDRMTLRFLEDSGWNLRYLNRRKSKLVVAERTRDYKIPMGLNGLSLPFTL